jgi:WD40 repeat protein
VAPSRDNAEIHAVSLDGLRDNLLWRIPEAIPPQDGIGALSWSPDGKAIAFDSAHQWHRSLAVRDIFVLNLESKQLLRPTNPPNPESFAKMPKGTVTVDVETPLGGRKLEVYVEGAEQPVTYISPGGKDNGVQLGNVADFGPGIPQYVRVYDYLLGDQTGLPCRFDLAAMADVEPGRTVHAGRMDFMTDMTCPITSSPAWGADGKAVLFLFSEPKRVAPSPVNIWQTPVVEGPLKEPVMSRLLDMAAWMMDTQEIFAIAAYPLPEFSYYVLRIAEGAGASIRIADTRHPRELATLNLGVPDCAWCHIFGIAWLPDGSGFLFSRHERPAAGQNFSGALYRYDIMTRRTKEIMRLSNELIGRLSVSPDGKQVAFERSAALDDAYPIAYTPLHGSRLLCPCSIWVAGIEGSSPHRIVADGRAPAWRPQPN